MKQAVVLIHGIGEQIPMDTLRGFVEAVWRRDGSVQNPHEPQPAMVWSKPDQASGDFELRRLTTPHNREGRRTDFFEFYWAHMMEGTEISHLAAWARLLLFRRPSRVPAQLRGLWYFLVFLALGIVLAVIAFKIWADDLPGWVMPTLSLLGTVLWVGVGAFVLKKIVGDAARYLHVAPENIESRRQIREAGIKLLDQLHTSGDYDRIIVVGHSLGTVIGYDILTHYWARCHDAFGPPSPTEQGATADPGPKPAAPDKSAKAGKETKGARATKASPEPAETAPGKPAAAVAKKGEQPTAARDALEALAREVLAREPQSFATDLPAWQEAQSAYFAELKASRHPWLVTDFVTLGSPLAHAALLMARTPEELANKKAEREFPTCPPVLEAITADGQTVQRFTYRPKNQWFPHHAAVFAPTRWTNLYFECHWTLWGDVIGGPVQGAFGPGIRDIPVNTPLRGGLFSHTLYWTFPPEPATPTPSWIEHLRQAVRICEQPPESA